MTATIIILKRENLPSDFSFGYVFRFPVADKIDEKYADPNKVSLWPEAPQEDIDAIRAGKFIEVAGILNAKIGSQLGDIKAQLQPMYNEQYKLQQVNDAKLFEFYGTTFDGSTWTDGGIK